MEAAVKNINEEKQSCRDVLPQICVLKKWGASVN
jgi:DNA-binding FrmR family transcriptional regulator